MSTENQFVDTTAEREVMGALLFDSDIFPDIRSIISPDHFSDGRLAAVFKNFGEQYETRGHLDLTTIAELAHVPVPFLAQCMVDVIPSLAPGKARRLSALANKRMVRMRALQVLSQLGTLTVEEVARNFSDIAADVVTSSSSKAVYDSASLCNRVVKLQEARAERRPEVRGLEIGYSILGRLLKGLQPKRITVIAAATGFGKSTLALNLLHNIIIAGHRALFISNENDVDLNLDRLCAIHSGLKVKDIESGEHYQVACSFGETFHRSGIFMTDNSPRTIEEVVGTISKFVIQHKVQVVFIDYIGEISHSGDNRETEEARLARYAQKLVDCAKSLGIHMVVMAQLNRQGNSKGRPSKAELAGCFKIAQKAHSLLLFWQDERRRDVLTVEKNRQGPAGIDIEMNFNRTTQQIFENSVLTAD
ncbi:AAA family ATPase [Geomonas sp. Red69]|uniref:DnaB-like helicase C-terminal domain-containing protein n=1 Tax=Geomonas diazotrophica TaxID=2843197 RepID=UPI001C108B99|nr:DnaB-like helicase C-terminal domain-containing protein [Geomonas diazotrophica]MBU5635499.1 AAA family ATPase [Geomonas diazotrophica]